MDQHSSFPWLVNSMREIIGGPDEILLAEVYDTAEGLEGDCPEADANARLIASAPDLLAALRRLVSMIEDRTILDVAGPGDIRDAYEAIAKATKA